MIIFHHCFIWQYDVNLKIAHLVSPACPWMTLSWSWQSAPPSEWLVRTWNRTTFRISMPYFCNPTSIYVGLAASQPKVGQVILDLDLAVGGFWSAGFVVQPMHLSLRAWHGDLVQSCEPYFEFALSSTWRCGFLPGSIFLAQASSASMFSEVAKYSNSTWPQFWGHFPSSRSEMVVLLRIWRNPKKGLND